MPEPTRQPTVADKLNKLYDDIRPQGRRGRRYTNDEVAAAIRTADPGIRVTGAYLSALRTGAKQNPSSELRIALARFFGLPAGYFFDEAIAAQTDAEIELARVAANSGVRRLALRALDLSPQGLAAVASMVEHVLALDREPSAHTSTDPPTGTHETRQPG